MHHTRRAGVFAGLLLALACALPSAAAAQQPANVTVRVEGQQRTLVPRTAVRTTTAPVVKDGTNSCPGTTALGALELATGGDWAGRFSPGLGYLVETVRGETHTSASGAPSGTYWAFWVNYRAASTGLCGAELQEGDEVLLFPDCFGTGCVNPTPLRLRSPATAGPGATFGVTVTEVVFDASFTATERPAANATVTASDGRTFTTNAEGIATVTAGADLTLRAEKPERVRSATDAVCVTTGADGRCGSPVPPGGPAITPPQPSTPCRTRGDDGLCGTVDRRAPRARIAGIEDGARYRRARAPRRLRGTVAADPSGIRAVRLRLTRRVGRRCFTWAASRERFVRARCGTGRFFTVGDRARWSYLLPERLAAGRYVLDVVAIDRAANRDRIKRGRSRVRFSVR